VNLNFTPFIVLWIALATAVIVLIVKRKMVANNEDDTLHVLQGAPIPNQVAVANKLEVIDKWGKLLTVITVVFGLLLAAAYVFQFFVQSAVVNPGK
jgi:hypothetical protein